MRINDERIKNLVSSFLKEINSIDLVHEYLSDIIFVTRKTARKDADDAIAYVVRNESKEVRSNPITKIQTYRICLIKEEVIALSDAEILNTLAHEMSHILIKLDRTHRQLESHILIERVCDVLAEHFFGFKKPKDSGIGYL
ncbi:MAG: hypothetical protein ACD_37C00288G0003 [uncultured bacterium]|nr:MAG: hypothetical protein ACD_37C00288G0003 [uncultured bacterium]